jgi:MFS family permease
MQWLRNHRIVGLPTPRYLQTSYKNYYTVNPYTITAYAKLYCGDEKNTRALIQSMLGIGAILGVLLINLISDYQGRKFSFILALLLGGLSVICKKR